MTDQYKIDQQHHNAIQRLEKSAELSRQRQEESEHRKERQRINAGIIEGANAKELMELQHELNKENRNLDHQFGLAEDGRELERQAIEIKLRQRDDFIRHHWANDSEILALEIRIVEMLVQQKSSASLSAQEHGQAKDLASHKNELEKDLLKLKQKLLIEYKKKVGNIDADTIETHLTRLHEDGIIS